MKPSALMRWALSGFTAFMLTVVTSSALPTPVQTYSSSNSYAPNSQVTNYWRWQYSPVGGTTYTDHSYFSFTNEWSTGTASNWSWSVFKSHRLMQPGTSADAVASFTAPSAGTLKIFNRVPARISALYNTVNGVGIQVLKNGTQIWPESGFVTVSQGREVDMPEMRVTVVPNDVIRFRVNCLGNGASDMLDWYFDVAYETLPETGVYTPASSYGATQTLGDWRWQRAAIATTTAPTPEPTPTDMTTYSSGIWWGTLNNYAFGSFRSASFMQPGVSADTVASFTCPSEGEIDIQTRAPVSITSGYFSTDGVRIKILKNNIQLWPATGWKLVGPNDKVVVPTIRTKVMPNDKIQFKVNHNAYGDSDDTTWHFGVAYAAIYKLGASLQSDIVASYKAQPNNTPKKYKIPPGVYKVPFPNIPGQDSHMQFDGLSNLEIDATDVRLLFEGTEPGIRFNNCTNITIRGLTTDYAKLAHTQGRITNIGNQFIEVEIDDGYPTDFDNITRFDPKPTGYIYDPATLTVKPGTADYYGSGNTSITRTGPKTFKVAFPFVESNVVKDDLMAFRSKCGIALLLNRCTAMKLLDVTVQGGLFGVLEISGGGRNIYDNYRVAYGPVPEGATRPRLLSTCADALHSSTMRIGPDIDGCVFTGMGDDGINVHGVYGVVVTNPTSNTFVVAFEPRVPLEVNDPVRIYSPTFALRRSEGTISQFVDTTNTPPPSPPTYEDGFLPKVYYTVTLTSPIDGLAKGDWVCFPNSAGKEFSISNTAIRNNRARGMIIRAENGVVSNNVFDGNSMHAILVESEILYTEADYASNVTISNNTIRNSGYNTTGNVARPAVLITSETKGVQYHNNITLIGNTFENNHWADLSIDSGTVFTVQNNTFKQRNSAAVGKIGYTEPHVILSNITDIVVNGNTFTTGRIAVSKAPSVTDYSGVSSVNFYSASAAFNNTQGTQGWSWKQVAVNTNTFANLGFYETSTSSWWATASKLYAQGKVNANTLQPGSTHDVSRTFVVPSTGTATLRTLLPITVASMASDGVKVQIMRNNAVIWPSSTTWQVVLPGTPVTPPDLTFSVVAGDLIHFRVNVYGNGNSDEVSWQPAVYLP